MRAGRPGGRQLPDDREVRVVEEVGLVMGHGMHCGLYLFTGLAVV